MSWDTDLEITDEIDGIEDFLIVDDLDLSDETELRRVVAAIESLLNSSNSSSRIGLRVSVLTSDQWQTVLSRVLPPSLKKGGADRFIHTFRDPNDRNHLLVSPTVVSGINEGSQAMYQELVYASLRCIPTDLSNGLRLGLDDILAASIAKDIKVDLFCKTHPKEMEIVLGLIKALSNQHGYRPLDWGLVMRRRPERFILALKKSDLVTNWLAISDERNLSLNRDNLISELEKDQINYSSVAIEVLFEAIKQTLGGKK